MNVNGVTGVSAYDSSAYKAKSSGDNVKNAQESSSASETGVIYEPGQEGSATPVKETKKYTPNTELVNKLKADAEARTSQLRSLVEKLITGQGNAIGQSDDIWSYLRTGNFTVDPATKAQAQADIAEDGYWGVKQTSDRIIDFAKALCGGDPSKIEEMRDAFKKGFDMATKTWGGKLPDISQQTYDATMEKFDQWAKEAAEIE